MHTDFASISTDKALDIYSPLYALANRHGARTFIIGALKFS
jgi:hypothetical protein